MLLGLCSERSGSRHCETRYQCCSVVSMVMKKRKKKKMVSWSWAEIGSECCSRETILRTISKRCPPSEQRGTLQFTSYHCERVDFVLIGTLALVLLIQSGVFLQISRLLDATYIIMAPGHVLDLHGYFFMLGDAKAQQTRRSRQELHKLYQAYSVAARNALPSRCRELRLHELVQC